MCDSCGAHAPGTAEMGHGHEWDPARELHGHDHPHGAGGDHDPFRSGHPAPLGAAPDGNRSGAARAARHEIGRAAGDLLHANQRGAERTRRELTRRGIAMFNLTSAPGSGKTALLHATLRRLPEGQVGVLVGDLETDRDAGRLHGLGAQVLQINTGKGCHLSAAQVAAGLDRLDLQGLRYLFVENVGNMACPADYDLGEHGRVSLLSLPEGDDKVAKYPGLFAAADVVLLNKVDLAGVLPFDESVLKADLACLNTHAPLLKVSALGGQGLDGWIDWLQDFRAKALAEPAAMTQDKA